MSPSLSADSPRHPDTPGAIQGTEAPVSALAGGAAGLDEAEARRVGAAGSLADAGPPDFGRLELRSAVPGRLRLRCRERSKCAELVDRSGIFDWSEPLGVGAVHAEPQRDSVLLRFDPRRQPQVVPVVERLADLGVRVPRAVRRHAARQKPFRRLPEPRTGGWRVKSSVPGRVRLAHPTLAEYPLVERRMNVALLGLPGVRHFAFTRTTSSVVVRFDPGQLTVDDLRQELDSVLRRLLEENADGIPLERSETSASTLHLSASTAGLGLALVAKAVPVLGPLAWAATAAASFHIFKSALDALIEERKLKVDVLDATVIALALRYQYVFAGALMVWVVDIGDVLLDKATRRSRELLTEVFGRQVRYAWLLVDGQEVRTEVADLELGDRVVVKAGDPIPVDGVVVDGDAMVDQHALTGEFAPVERTAGESVFAMTGVLAGHLVVEVRETGSDTRAAQIVRIIEHSVEHKVRLQSLSEYFADIMVAPTLGLGALGRLLVGPGAMMAIINADFGTGIRIAGPLALLSSLSLAAKHGIIVKNGGALESLHTLDAIVFDKTGTLTEETPVVERVRSLDPEIDEDQLLAWVACAEHRFAHPIARAIVARAVERGLDLPVVDESDYHVGFGIEVRFEELHLKVGSRRYMEREGVEIPPEVEADLEELLESGGSAVYAAADRRLVGLIELRAAARPEAYRIVENLRRRGIEHIFLISGDNEPATRALAERLGIDDYFAEVLPEDKARYVEELQARGLKVGMVGDGINDSVALSRADYSFSLRGAADVATDVADIVFMDGDFSKFDMLFEISENLRDNVKRSFVLTLVPNSVCIGGAFLGIFGLGMSLIFNNAFNLVVTINGLLPMYALRDDDHETNLALDRQRFLAERALEETA